MNQPDLLTVEEAAAYLRVNLVTLYRLLKRGALPGVKVGYQWRILRADLDQLLSRSPKKRET